MDKKFDCVVIGAGVVGVSSAIWMQREGLSVALVDPNEPGGGASYGNAGCFNGSSIVPMSMPGMLPKVPGWLLDPMGPLSIRKSYLLEILPWLWRFLRAGQLGKVKHQAKALRSLLGPSLPYLKQMIGPANLDELVRTEGHLYVYRDEATFASDQLGWLLRRENGVRFEELSEQQIRDFDPALSTDYCRGVWIPDNGHTTNPGRLVAALAEHFVGSGGQLIRASANAFRFVDGILNGVDTDHGPITGRAVVVAAGAYSGKLAALLGERIPLETERGYHVVIHDSEIRPRVPTTDASGKFVATPMEMGLRLAGTVELGGLKALPNWDRANRLVSHGQSMFPDLQVRPGDNRLRFWMGHRPSLPDSLPVIARSKHCPEVIYAFGHGHVGMTGAPLTGKVVCDMILGREPSIDLTPFKADRF